MCRLWLIQHALSNRNIVQGLGKCTYEKRFLKPPKSDYFANSEHMLHMCKRPTLNHAKLFILQLGLHSVFNYGAKLT